MQNASTARAESVQTVARIAGVLLLLSIVCLKGVNLAKWQTSQP